MVYAQIINEIVSPHRLIASFPFVVEKLYLCRQYILNPMKLKEDIKFVAKHIAIAFVAVCVLGVCVLQILKFATHHGEAIVMPDLVGMNLSEVELVLGDQGLECMVVDSVHEKNRAPGEVVEQHPVAGTKVKSGRIVYLTINSMRAEEKIVRDMRNRPFREVRGELESLGFVVTDEDIIRVPSEYSNLVLDARYKGRSLEGGERIPVGSRIVLEVGAAEGEGGMVIVPHLTGVSSLTAQTMIRESSLTVGRLDYDETPNGNEDSYYVYWQSKRPGANTPAGSRIDLRLSRDPHKQAPTQTYDEDDEFF